MSRIFALTSGADGLIKSAAILGMILCVPIIWAAVVYAMDALIGRALYLTAATLTLFTASVIVLVVVG